MSQLYVVIESDNTMITKFQRLDKLSSLQTLLFCLETVENGKQCKCRCYSTLSYSEPNAEFPNHYSCVFCKHSRDRHKDLNYSTLGEESVKKIGLKIPPVNSSSKNEDNNSDCNVITEEISPTITKIVFKDSPLSDVSDNSDIGYVFSSISSLPITMSSEKFKEAKSTQDSLKRSKSVNYLMNKLDSSADSMFLSNQKNKTNHLRHLSSDFYDIFNSHNSSGLSLPKTKTIKFHLVESPSDSSNELEDTSNKFNDGDDLIGIDI